MGKKSKKILNKKVLIVLLILVIIGAIGFIIQKNKKVMVESYTVDQGIVKLYIEEIGELKPEKTVYSKAQVNGLIKNISVKEGDIVKKDDKIIELDTENLELELKSLEANLNGLYAELEEASSGAEQEMIAKLNANIQIAENEYEQYKTNYEKQQVLFDSGAISQSELDSAKLLFENSLERLNIARNDLWLQTKALSESLKSTYEAQINSLSFQIEQVKNQIENSTIQAELDGIVMELLAEEGDFATQGQMLLEISATDQYIIETDVLAADVVTLEVGQQVVIEDPESDLVWEGKVSKIYPKAFSTISDLGIEQKRVKVEIIPNEIAITQYGYELDIKIITSQVKDVARIRNSCIFKMSGENTVFLIQQRQLVLQPVQLGLEGEEYSQILNGLNVGDHVVNSPDNSLKEGVMVMEENDL